MPFGKTPKSVLVRPCAVRSANIAGQDTCPGSALYMERNVGNAAKKTTSRQFADLCGTTGELVGHEDAR